MKKFLRTKTAAPMLIVGALSLLPQVAQADVQADMVRRLVDRYKPSLVTLKLVVKLSMGGYGERQTEMEADGLLLNGSGLVVTTNTAIDPAASSGASDEEGGSRLTTKVSSVKILTTNGDELPARVVLRDKDRNMAFVRPLRAPAKALVSIPFGTAGRARIGDPVYVLGRLGKAGNRSAEVKVPRIVSVIEKPRLMYVLDSYSYIYLGNAVFNEKGQPLGMLSMRVGRSARAATAARPIRFCRLSSPPKTCWKSRARRRKLKT